MALILPTIVRNEFAKKHLPAVGHSSSGAVVAFSDIADGAQRLALFADLDLAVASAELACVCTIANN